MREYIVTFGSGQKYENYFIKVFSNEYSNVFEFMKKIYDDKYCMIYPIEEWMKWEEKAKKNNLKFEVEMCSINLDQDKLFVLYDNSRDMYWKKNNFGYTRLLSYARIFTFASAIEKANAPAVNDLEIILYNQAEKLLPGYELEIEIAELVEDVNISKNYNGETEIELEFKEEQTKDEIESIKRFVIELLKNKN